MELHQKIDSINSNEELANFIADLRADLIAHPEEWENLTLGEFLQAMEEWTRSIEDFCKNTGQALPSIPNWKTLARILYASKFYE